MRLKTFFLLSLLAVVLIGCKKDEVPQQEDYYFTYEVKMSNRITEPTIINGIYGHVLLYEGNFMPSTDGNVKAPDTVRNDLYFYEASLLEEIQKAKVQKNGTTFYDLKALRKNDVKAKFVVSPNKKGFYQVDTNNNEFLVLIEAKKNLGYFKNGPLKIGSSSVRLTELDMKIDYDATY